MRRITATLSLLILYVVHAGKQPPLLPLVPEGFWSRSWPSSGRERLVACEAAPDREDGDEPHHRQDDEPEAEGPGAVLRGDGVHRTEINAEKAR